MCIRDRRREALLALEEKLLQGYRRDGAASPEAEKLGCGADKRTPFNFDVQVINGNDFDELEKAFEHAKTVKGKPSAIIAKTIKGKDVSFMENDAGWHGKAPNAEEYEVAMKDLNKILSGLEAE